MLGAIIGDIVGSRWEFAPTFGRKRQIFAPTFGFIMYLVPENVIFEPKI